MRTPFLLVLLGTLACESGTSESYAISIDPELGLAYSTDAPGLLGVDSSPGRVFRVLCGQELAQPVQLSLDNGFGCLDDGLKGTSVDRLAYIQPMPETWDAEALCAIPEPEQPWDAVPIDALELGTDEPWLDLNVPIDEAWDQGMGSGEWKSDLSPCGGHLDVEIVIE